MPNLAPTAADSLAEELELFRDLTEAELASVVALLHTTYVPAGCRVPLEDRPDHGLYLLLAGTVKLAIPQVYGTDVIVSILGRGELLGWDDLLEVGGGSVELLALEDVTAAWIEHAQFDHVLGATPALARNLALALAQRLRRANAHIHALAAYGVYGRVAAELLALADDFGGIDGNGDTRICLRLTQDDLAGLVGASRVRVNQVIGSYKRLGYVSVDHDHRITIHDQAALAQHCR